MNELIKIENRDGRQTVSARELHEFLEVQTAYKDWIRARVGKYGFIEGIDFLAIAEKKATAQGNLSEFKVHHISIDMAKELSMVENNEKGQAARRYFIECERKLKSPMTLEEMTVKVISGMQERVKALESKVQTDAPKVEAFDTFISSEGLLSVEETGKLLGIGRNIFFRELRQLGILIENTNLPYQNHLNSGRFMVKAVTKEIGGNPVVFKTTFFTSKGVDWIRQVFERQGR